MSAGRQTYTSDGSGKTNYNQGFKENRNPNYGKNNNNNSTNTNALGRKKYLVDGTVAPIQKGEPVTKPYVSNLPSSRSNLQVDLPLLNNKPINYGPSGSSYTVPSTDYFSELLSAFESESASARDAAIAAIMANLKSVKGAYQSQIDSIGDEYDRLVDENEVKKERARRVIRENQANRGQLDTGLGRQEQLNMNIGYDNITSNLQSARRKAINDIMNLITQAEAEARSNEANVRSNYANSLLQFKLANM